MEFTDLEVYQLSEELTLLVYKVTAHFPKEEVYGLTSQMRKAVLSIGANIAEGFGRYHYKDRVNFLYNSRGSLLEVKHLLNLAEKLKFIKEEDMQELNSLIKKLGIKLNNYIQSTKERTV